MRAICIATLLFSPGGFAQAKIQATAPASSHLAPLSCAKLNNELGRLTKEIFNLSRSLSEKDHWDFQVVVGMTIYWPSVFLIGRDDHKQEALERALIEIEEIATLSARKKCRGMGQ